MISLSSTSFAAFILCIFMLLKKIDFAVYALCFVSALTTVAVVYIGESENILIFHLVFAILFFKTIINKNKIADYKCSVNIFLLLFPIWALITIPFSLFHSDTVVQNIENIYSKVFFSVQQITQYAYLLIGILTCVIINLLLKNKLISIDSILKVVEWSYIVVCSLALLQLILPVDFVNEFYRNSVHSIYKYKGARISGTFSEPSMLALFATPLFSMYLYNFITGFKIKYLILSIMFVIITLLNQSSSAFIGMALGFVMILFFFPYNRRILKKNLFFVIISVLLIFTFVFVNFEKIYDLIIISLDKLRGNGVSGSSRSSSFNHHMKVFIDNFFIGIGYGTVRSYDLFTTWASEMGIIGLALYFIPLIGLFFNLIKIKTQMSIQLLIYCAVYNIILFVSTCEIIQLQIWIFYGVAFHYVYEQRCNEKNMISNRLNNLKLEEK